MLTLAFAVLALVTLVVPAAASERAEKDKPVLRATPPTRVDAPRAASGPTRVVAPARAEKSRGGTAKVNINTADVKALMTLTGVGRKVAENIVEYRDSHGPFTKPDDVRKVEGVGNGVWERNRGRIVVK